MSPLVSILVPTYNGERFLADALRSALGQTHRDIEVIVGDDASTDRTPDLLAAAAAGDPRVRVLRHAQNVGPYDNPKRLLDAARGEYVKFLLHDDLLEPDCVRVLLDGLRVNPSTRLAFSRRTPIDEHGRQLDLAGFAALSSGPGVMDGRQLGDAMLQTCRNAVGELTTVLFRRRDVDPESLWQVDGRRLAGIGDLALWLDLLAQGDAFYSPLVLSRFRQHRTQRSRDVRITAGSVRDWPWVIDWARRRGFLAQVAQERQAHAAALRLAADVHAAAVDSPDSALALEAVLLSTARLVELGTEVDLDAQSPIAHRAHGPRLLELLTNELDVLVRRYTGAVAAPTADAGEVQATIQVFRQLAATDRTHRFVLAVEPSLVGQVVPLVEAALATGPDLDVDLVATDEPGQVLGETWLAVAPRGQGSWHAGRALSLLDFDVPSTGAPDD